MKKSELITLSSLFGIAGELSAAPDLDALLKKISTAAENLLTAEASSILLLDEDGKHLYFKVATGEKGGSVKRFRVEIGQGIAGWVAQNRKPLIVNDVQNDTRFYNRLDNASGFKTRNIVAIPLLTSGELVGVAEVLNKQSRQGFTDEDLQVLENLGNLVAIAISNAQLKEVQRSFFANSLEILTKAVECRDGRLSGHCWRVARIVSLLAREQDVPEEQFRHLYYAALLHDLGTINIQGNIPNLHLWPEDNTVEKTHPLLGEELLGSLSLLRQAAPLVAVHHEYYDGSGYPLGRKGEEMPIEARIIPLVEASEAMRISGFPLENIRQTIFRERGRKFDPKVSDIFLDNFTLIFEEREIS